MYIVASNQRARTASLCLIPALWLGLALAFVGLRFLENMVDGIDLKIHLNSVLIKIKKKKKKSNLGPWMQNIRFRFC